MKVFLPIKGLCITILLLGALDFAWAEEKPVWPEPPEMARIRYVSSIYSSQDLGIEKKFWSKVVDFVLGRDSRSESLVKPLSLCVDGMGRLYVTDQGLRTLHVFDQKDKSYQRIDHAGSTPFISPVDVVVSQSRKIFISDSEIGSVFILNEKGRLEYAIEGYFSRPTGLCIYQNRLYVADTGYHKIFIFNLDGTYLFEFGQQGIGPGEFNFPVFMGTGKHLYINDSMNFRVQAVNESHKITNIFGEQGDVQGTFMRSKGIASDSQDHIYVVDNLFNVFQIFNAEGQLLLVVGSPGNGHGQFNMPSGIWIDNNDKIYIADTMNGRIQIFQYLRSSSND
ncbi:MAG: 6-bladed beta-propeller [Candidatus Marinimicrobia bacterium]|nr:6-bladed beta-propeller [Candidatus Neomarinimicrobiota bacterium]